ncbi:MAG: FMN-binding protein, partial [Rhodospirillales bacterium]|nr:FMN-binding protein [Rhodospirillales bacterium]
MANANDSAPTHVLDLAQVFPGADRTGPPEGDVPSAPAYKGDELIGYIFSTLDTVGTIGFSGKPIDITVGMNLSGDITGAQIRHHSEPILIIGVSPDALESFVAGFKGINVGTMLKERKDTKSGVGATPDAVAGASISSAVIADGIIRAG